MRSGERKLSQIPLFVIIGLIVFAVIQVSYHQFFQSSTASSYQKLDNPGEAKYYRALSFGSDQLLSYMMMLAVQMHDNQKGRHLSYRHLDYAVLSDWLLMLYKLNPHSDYPAFMATRVYSQVADKKKVRQMIGVVDTLFDGNPEKHWRRMTEACLLAKHKLKDLPLALELAQKVANMSAAIKLPHWARDMKLVLLDELNQLESAQLLISSMLQSGEVKDPDEIRFLRSRLLKIQQKMLGNKQ